MIFTNKWRRGWYTGDSQKELGLGEKGKSIKEVEDMKIKTFKSRTVDE